MSNTIEKTDWYEANDFTGENALEAVNALYIKTRNGSVGDSRINNIGNGYRRFYGALPGMLESRGRFILQVPGLSIIQMIQRGLLDDDVLGKLKEAYCYDNIVYQDSGPVDFAYPKEQLEIPGSSGKTLKEQRIILEDYCKGVMDNATGISRGMLSLRETIGFARTYYSLYGKYPIREDRAIRTSNVLWVKGNVEYHPTVCVYGSGARAGKLTVEVMGEDVRDFGTGVGSFWIPSQQAA